MNNNLTEIIFILDKSGSMWNLANDTVGGFNSMLEKQKNGEGECLLSTVLFNHHSQVLYDRVPIEEAKTMTTGDYVPEGSTALYDALGDAIHHISNVHKYAREEDRPGKTLVIVTTDGMENASRHYTGSALHELIEKKKTEGWEFLFLASDLGALEQAKHIGFAEERMSVMESTPHGTFAAFDCCTEVMHSYRSKKSIAKDWNKAIVEQMKNSQKKGDQ